MPLEPRWVRRCCRAPTGDHQSASYGRGGKMDVKEINRRVIEQFRAGGEIGGRHRDRLLLLTTTGAKTGGRHTTPMTFHRAGDRVLVGASHMGGRKHPDWYLNLVANPRVVVEAGGERFKAVTVPDGGAELEPLWSMLK